MALAGYRVLSDDAIWKMIGNGNYKQGYTAKMAGSLPWMMRQMAATLLGLGHNVVIDAPSHTQALREVYEFGPMVRHVSIGLIWDYPDVHALRRYASDDRGYTLDEWMGVALALDREHQFVAPSEPWELLSGTQIIPGLKLDSGPAFPPRPKDGDSC